VASGLPYRSFGVTAVTDGWPLHVRAMWDLPGRGRWRGIPPGGTWRLVRRGGVRPDGKCPHGARQRQPVLSGAVRERARV